MNPIEDFNDMVELLEENGYFINEIEGFSTFSYNRFNVKLDIQTTD